MLSMILVVEVLVVAIAVIPFTSLDVADVLTLVVAVVGPFANGRAAVAVALVPPAILRQAKLCNTAMPGTRPLEHGARRRALSLAYCAIVPCFQSSIAA